MILNWTNFPTVSTQSTPQSKVGWCASGCVRVFEDQQSTINVKSGVWTNIMTTIFHPELSFRARLILYNSNRNRQSRLVPGAWTINLEIGLSWLILLKWRPSWLYGHIWWYLRAIQGIGNLLSMPVGQWCLHRLKFPSYSLPLMVSWAWSGRLVHWQCAIDFLSHNDPHLPQVFYNDMCQTLSLNLLTNTQQSITQFERTSGETT